MYAPALPGVPFVVTPVVYSDPPPCVPSLVVENLKGGKNLTVETLNLDGNVQFLYKLIDGGAAQSYGIYVAKLAGLPNQILERSSELLETFEEPQKIKSPKEDAQKLKIEKRVSPKPGSQLCFFGDEQPSDYKTPKHLSKIEEEIKKLDILTLTPLDAFQKLHKLKSFMTLQ